MYKKNDKRNPYMPKLNKVGKGTMKKVYAEKDVETKKNLIRDIINEFSYQKKVPEFLHKVSQCKSITELDVLATNIYLFGEGLGV